MDDINQIGAATLGDQPSEVNQVGAATLNEEDLPRKLADATDYYRRNASDFWGPGTKAYLESRLPGVSEQQSIEHAGRVRESARALQEGWAKPEHIYTLAQDQARKEYEASRQGWDKAVDLATSLPKMGAEYYLGGKVAQAIPGMAGANFAQTEAARAAFMPSTYEDIAHRYASGEGLEASAFKGALAGTIQNVAMSAAGTFLPKLATQGGVGYLKGAAYSAAKAVGGAQAAKEGLYQAALSGDPSEIHKIATGPDRLQAIKDMGPEILVFGSLEAALHGIPILAEHIADLKREGVKPESLKGQEQIAQTVDQLRQEAAPPAPKAYANHPDDQLIELAQGLGMDGKDKAAKGDFTRADAEKYLQKHGVREEMLDEPRPAKPQVIRPEAQQQAIDALVRSGMSQEEATRRTAEAFANAPQTVFPKTEGAKLKTSPSLDALDAEFEVIPPKSAENKAPSPPTEPVPPSTIPPEAKASRAHQAQPEPPAQTPEERVAALRAQHAASQAQVDQATRAETEAIQRRRKGLKADVEGARATRQAWEERHAVLEDKIRAAGGIVPGEEPVPPKDFAPVAKEMGLNDREQYVLLKKSEGALNPDLVGDPNLPGITTRGGVNAIEVRAREKVNKYLKEHGLKEMGSINETVAKPDQESAKEEAKSIRTDALDKQGGGAGFVDQGEQAGYSKDNRTPQEVLRDDWNSYAIKLAKKGRLTDEQWADINRRYEAGETPPNEAAGREPAHEAPVRPASGGGVPEGAESSSANPPHETPQRAQGQREPAPAGGSEAAGNELSKDSPFHPDNLQAQANEILANNKEAVDRHNEILREARSALKEYGGDYRLIHLERYADATSIKGLDQVAEHLQAEHPEWFTGRENTDDTLFNILKAGNKKYLTKDQALRQAETWAHGQATPEDVTEANQELKKANLGQATRDDLREVERQARLEVAKQAGIDPDELGLGDAHESTGDASFDFGGDPGEPGRPVSREQAVENWQDRFEDAPAGTQTNFLPGSFGSLTGEQRSLFDTSAVKGEHTQKPDMPGQTHFNFGEPVSPEERTGLPGGGQEAPEQSRPQRLTALANEITERERAKEKLPPLSPSERLENSEVWQGALRAVEKDPEAPQRLIDELSKKMRPVTVEENALLLYQKVALKNELERATLSFLAETKGKRMQDVDAITWARLMEPVTELEDRLFKTQQLIHDAGTPLGRALQFRKQLAAEDYSLGGMLMEASAAKGDRLTPEERVKIAEMSAKIADLEAKLKEAQANAEGAKLGTKARKEADKARVDTQAAKDEFTRMTNDWRRQPRGPIRKLTDLLTKIRVNEVISSPVTAGKIITASMERVATTTLEEAAGAMLRKIPGLDKIAALAPRQGRGFSLAKEMSLAKEAFTTGLKDAWQTARTGESDIDILHKPKGDKLSRDFLDYQFSLHDAAKAPAVRAEYTRSLLDRQEHMIANGIDPTTPARVMQNELLAYKDSQAAKFRQENWLVDSYNRMVNSLRSEKAPVASQITGGALKILTPVVRIPTNLAFEVATHVFGTGTGTIQAARAFSRGLENLKPGEADQIMRQFKKGSLGAALLLVGVFNRNSIGGYYSGKRDEGDVKAGTIRIGGVDLPAWVLHNPLLETMQIGATLGRAYDKFTRKGDSKVSAAAEATGQTVAGWLEELPLVRETGQVTGLTSPRDSERGHAWAEMTKSLAIPQFFQWLAGATDRNSQGKPIERKPKGFAETVKVGVPGLRQSVPVK